MSVKKYFLAIVIPGPLYEKAEEIKQDLFLKHGLKGSLRSPSHITLHRPFEWKEEKENVLIEKLNLFKFEDKVNVELNDFSFFEPRVIFIDVLLNPELINLQKAIKQFAKKELSLFNEVNDMRGFHPHVTVASRDLKKPKFYELQAEFATKKFQGSFACKNFCLLKMDKKWKAYKFFEF